MEVLTNLIVIILQYIPVLNQITPLYTLNLHMMYINNISVKLGKKQRENSDSSPCPGFFVPIIFYNPMCFLNVCIHITKVPSNIYFIY